MPKEAANDQAPVKGQSSGEPVSPQQEFMRRLLAEDGESADDQPDPAQAAKADADEGVGDGDEGESNDTDALTDEGDSETGDDGDGDEVGDADHVVIDGEVYEVTAVKAALAEADHGRMRLADYTRKTQVLARLNREAEVLGEEAQSMAHVFENLAQQSAQRFAGVNWDQLRAQNPDQFTQLRQEFDVAQAGVQQTKQITQTVAERLKQQRETSRRKEAQLSMDILESGIIEGWNGERYTQLRDYAVGAGLYEAEEFNNLTDWRVMVGLDAAERQAAVKTKLKEALKSTSGKKVTAGTQAPTREIKQGKRLTVVRNAPQRRNPSGKFTTAERTFQERPGDRGAAVDFFRERLLRDG